MDNPVIMHCNYAEQGQTLDQMCELAARAGFDGVEFRRKRAAVPQSPTEYLDEIAAGVKKHGLRHVLFGGPGPNLAANDADTRRRELDDVIAFYRLAAKRFDLSVCNITAGSVRNPDKDYMEFDQHGSNLATEEQWEAAVSGFQELGDLATELGFRFAFETHNVFIHDLPEPTRRLIDRIDRDSIGANLDYGNILLHPNVTPLDKTFEVLAGRIYMLHLKNMFLIPQRKYHQWISCALEAGAINNRSLLRQAKAQGMAGPIAIEAPQPGDREWFAKTDLAYLRTLMAEL